MNPTIIFVIGLTIFGFVSMIVLASLVDNELERMEV